MKSKIKKKLIKIYVKNGCVVDVKNLPKDYKYQIIDYDANPE